MKKLIVIVALIGIVFTLNAQDRIAVGLKAGFNSTKIKISDFTSSDNLDDIKNNAKSGFLFGAYGKVRLIGSLSFQPELYYAKKTSELKAYYNGGFDVSQNDFHTWDIPLLANLQLLDLSVIKVYGVAGPVASFIAKTKTDIPELDEYKKANWTFQAGAGVQIWRLTADVRYEWGLSDISDLADYNIGQKTDVLTFSVGYRLFGL
ncbi:porin family protein [Carboxylicivirga caseinilyticus]|uniref:porin family protein n=1 Tax=Carboxylicivirga caseinilyticus TaxID=3417572 RepID=UPI003D32A678|nr:PorT family protein [Marinilabiliaceae bacterium A049]